MTRPKIVAFDLGGVLVDVEIAKLAARLGRPADECDAAFFGGGLHDDVTIGAVDGDAFVAEAARRLGCAPALARDAWACFVEAMPGADALVRALTVPCVAWSNTDPVHWARIAEQLPSLCGAAQRCSSFHVGAAKPDASYYQRAVAVLGLRPDEILFVDDRAENVAAARAHGVDARHVRGVAEARAAITSALT